MIVKRSGKTIFGADLTAAERKAMDMEIQRELAEYDKAHALEIDAMVLWVLKQTRDYTTEELRAFYDEFAPTFDALLERYEMETADGLWLCTKRLKDCGVDIAQWDRERKKESGKK